MSADLADVEMFTDGACKGNPGPGGWGVVIRAGAREKELSGGEPLTTNNRRELTAAIHGWRKNGWKTADKKPVKNAELWQALLEACAPHRIEWHWVKGHSGHPENDRADALACAEALRFPRS